MNYSRILSSSSISNLEKEIDTLLAQTQYNGKTGFWKPQGGPWFNSILGHNCQLMLFTDIHDTSKIR